MSLKGTLDKDFEGYVEYVSTIDEGDLKNVFETDVYSETAELVIKAADEKYNDEFFLVDTDKGLNGIIKLILCKC